MRVLLLLVLVGAMWVQSALATSQGTVLVLGSKGLIGTALIDWLHANNYTTAEVYNRAHIDLRMPGALDTFTNISFVYFLACEVGGSKYIDGSNTQLEIIDSNIHIYQTVFEWLARTRTPYVFTSSYLQSQNTAYGSVKRLGEAWIKALGFGRSARLWNIYGPERLGPRSHVLGDWIHSCITRGTIHSLTDGTEYRQFLHVRDTATGLGQMMERYALLEPITDLSTGVWHAMGEVGQLVTEQGACSITYSPVHAITCSQVSPNLTTTFHDYWQATISLATGVELMFSHYRDSCR